MTMNEEENIYVKGNVVTMFNVCGEQIEKIEVPENRTANAVHRGDGFAVFD